ncbi:MAG TPA: sensor histidine kinase [Acidimicrobiales bacterium]|nr:sensor histidine kinase [Acidimicrobiales bacterium]
MSQPSEARERLRPPLLHRITPEQLQGVDYAIALLLLLAALRHAVTVSVGHRFLVNQAAPHGTVFALAIGAALPIALRRRYPVQSLVIATVALSVATAVGQSFAPDPLIALPMYQVASVRERRESFLWLAAAGVALLVAAVVGATNNPSEGDATFSVLVAIAAWFVGDSVRARRAYTAGLREQASQRAREELERAQRGVAEERLRIARELHDVVAHSLSVIAVQSGVGRHVIDDQPDQAKELLGSVESTSRSALTELRRMLGMLRQEDPGADLAPAPGIGDLGALANQVRAVDIGVTLDIEEPQRRYSSALELTVYRIVQEALTNVVKHAGPTSAHVVLRREGGALVVEVTDSGMGLTDGSVDQVTSVHHGIVGMRERVALFGGSLTAGPRPGGGFQVVARLPVEGGTS